MGAPLCPLASGNAEFFGVTAPVVNYFGVDLVSDAPMKSSRARNSLTIGLSKAPIGPTGERNSGDDHLFMSRPATL